MVQNGVSIAETPGSKQELPARVERGEGDGQVAGGGLYSWDSSLATLDFLRAALLS